MSGVASKFSLLSKGILNMVSFQNLLKNFETRRILRKQLSVLQRTHEHTSKHRFSTSSHLQTIISSKEADLKIKDESLKEYLFPKFDNYGNTVALESGNVCCLLGDGVSVTTSDELLSVDFLTGRPFSYTELKEYVIKIASALNRLGYKKNDTIAVFAANSPEYVFFLLSCAVSGIVVTTANPAYTSSELCRHLTHSGACALVVHQPLIKTAKDAIETDGSLRTAIKDIIVIGEANGCRPFSSLLEDDGKCFPENVDINPVDDTVVMPYSSGTTGLPKGVMLSHMNIVSNLQQFRPLLRVTPEDMSLLIMPLYHCYGMILVMMGVLQDGGQLVTVPRFDPKMFLKAIMTYKVTQLQIVPPIIVFMAKHPIVSKFDLSSLTRVFSGAAPLGESITAELFDRIKAPVTQSYGMTETSPVLLIDTLPPNPGCAGFLVPNTQAKVVCPETGKELKTGDTGELCFKGPQNMKGYYKNEKATQEMIRDGWLHSGDVGHVDKQGRFYVTDRLKELIKFKGYQIAPAELEDLLLNHAGVQDAAVIGVPDKDAGEIPRAYIVSKADQKPTEQDILTFVEDHAAPYKKLRGGVVFVEEIPKSPSGKILRRILREKLAHN